MFTGSYGFKVILIELKQHRSLHQERLAVYQQIERMHLLDPKTLSDRDLFPINRAHNGIQFELVG
jgi:hypothetical protein